MTNRFPLSRRRFLGTAAAAGALAAGGLGAPAILHAQTATLRITTWGGKWGEIMKGEVLPAFEKANACRVEVDSAFPFVPKLLASPRSDPVYDVFHSNSNEQWALYERGLIDAKPDARLVPNMADLFDYATSDKTVGVVMFTSAIGLAYRKDKVANPPKSWKDFWDPRFAGKRGAYVIPANSLGQALFMLSGQLYGSGMTDLDAAYQAMEKLKPVRLYDFTGSMEKALLSGEVEVGVLHDSGVLRYTGQDHPLAFVAPSEGVIALEQVLSVTSGSKRKELAHAYIDYMLSPPIQKKLSEGVWYSPANKKVTLEPAYQKVLFDTPEEVKSLIQVDWKWYNPKKDQIDQRVNRIFR